MKFYLLLNALFYGLLAFWCTVKHGTTSAASGFVSLNNSGHSEYLVIYGGLQLGLTAFYVYAGTHPEHYRFGILVSIFLYTPIVIYRWVTIIQFNPVSSITLATGGLETALLIGALALWFIKR